MLDVRLFRRPTGARDLRVFLITVGIYVLRLCLMLTTIFEEYEVKFERFANRDEVVTGDRR